MPSTTIQSLFDTHVDNLTHIHNSSTHKYTQTPTDRHTLTHSQMHKQTALIKT